MLSSSELDLQDQLGFHRYMLLLPFPILYSVHYQVDGADRLYYTTSLASEHLPEDAGFWGCPDDTVEPPDVDSDNEDAAHIEGILEPPNPCQAHGDDEVCEMCDDYYERMDESEEEDYEATINFAIWMDRQADDSSAAV